MYKTQLGGSLVWAKALKSELKIVSLFALARVHAAGAEYYCRLKIGFSFGIQFGFSLHLNKNHSIFESCYVFGSTFNFSVSELSWLAVILLILACLVLHYIPIRILLLLWGCVKFSRRLLRPHTVPNNEILDLLSRVPDDDQMVWINAVHLKLTRIYRESKKI